MNFEVFRDYRRIAEFLGVGVVGLLVENGVLYFMIEFFDIGLVWSKVLALEAAIIVVFYMNDRFTFSQFQKKAYALLRTNLVRGGGTLISFAGLLLGVEFLSLHYLVANSGGVLFGSVFNYYFERVITWDAI